MTCSKKPCHKEIAQLIRERLDALDGRKSVAQIAHEAGHQNENFLLAIAAGRARVPVDHAVAIGTALELDPLEFYCKVVECYLPLPPGLVFAREPVPVASRPSVDLNSIRPNVDLNFKVDPDFHQSFKTEATIRRMSMKELLEASFKAFLEFDIRKPFD
jgi:hypothetical protein